MRNGSLLQQPFSRGCHSTPSGPECRLKPETTQEGSNPRFSALISNETSIFRLAHRLPLKNQGKSLHLSKGDSHKGPAAMTSSPLIRACNHHAAREWASGTATRQASCLQSLPGVRCRLTALSLFPAFPGILLCSWRVRCDGRNAGVSMKIGLITSLS